MAETRSGHGAGAATPAGLTWQLLKSIFPLVPSVRRQFWAVLSELEIVEARRGDDILFYGNLLAKMREDIGFVARLDATMAKSAKKKDRDRMFLLRATRWLRTRAPDSRDSGGLGRDPFEWPRDLFPEGTAEREVHNLLQDLLDLPPPIEGPLEERLRETHGALTESLEGIDLMEPDALPQTVAAAREFADAADAYLRDIRAVGARCARLQKALRPLADDAAVAALTARLDELDSMTLFTCEKLFYRHAGDVEKYAQAKDLLDEEEQRFDRLRKEGKPWSALAPSVEKIAALERERDEARAVLAELTDGLAKVESLRRAAAETVPAAAKPRRRAAENGGDAAAVGERPDGPRPASRGRPAPGGGAAAAGAAVIAPPMSWAEFPDWCTTHLKDSLVLSSRALKAIKKARYRDVAEAARCMSWLAGDYRRGRIGGAGDELQGSIGSGLWNERCGADGFDYQWDGERIRVDWHIKNGGNTRDPDRCLRIYYSWDEARQRVVVADMPAHRRSAGT